MLVWTFSVLGVNNNLRELNSRYSKKSFLFSIFENFQLVNLLKSLFNIFLSFGKKLDLSISSSKKLFNHSIAPDSAS
jgi:hypothetical protein